jgi:hypothetical protein
MARPKKQLQPTQDANNTSLKGDGISMPSDMKDFSKDLIKDLNKNTGMIYGVNFEINITDFPEFTDLKEKTPIEIEGKILEIVDFLFTFEIDAKKINGRKVKSKVDNKKSVVDKPEKLGGAGLIEKITNNSTLANVFGALIIIAIFYIIYIITGINLSKFN